jgi:hypothetical protein
MRPDSERQMNFVCAPTRPQPTCAWDSTAMSSLTFAVTPAQLSDFPT